MEMDSKKATRDIGIDLIKSKIILRSNRKLGTLKILIPASSSPIVLSLWLS
jgi:hypothetical protein